MLYQMGEIENADIKGELLARGILPKAPKAKKPSNKANYYVNTISAFDIETTRLDLSKDPNQHDYHSFMYIWQMQIGSNITIVGRYWEEFTQLVDILVKALYDISEEEKLPEIPHLVCFIQLY